MTIQSPIKEYLNENSEKFKSLNNFALSTVVRYSTNLKYAYVYLFEDVTHPFSIDKPQLIDAIYCVRLKRQTVTNSYKVYNFVDELPIHYMTTVKNTLK